MMKMINKLRQTVISILPLIIFFFSNIGLSQSSVKEVFSLGISSEIFEEININDAKVTLSLWGKLITSEIQNVENMEIIVYEDLETIINDSKENKIDIMYLSSLMYAKYEKKINLIPVLSTKLNEKDFYNLNLLTSNKKGDISFSDLKNAYILVQGGKYRKITELWLDYLALQNGVKDKNTHFKKIEFVEKPMQAVLPTIMGKADYCIVNSASLEAMAELNPQVTKNLKSVFTSQGFSSDLVCVSKLLTEEERELVTKIALNFHDLPKNEQLFKIFRTYGAEKFKESDLDGIKVLIKNYNDLIINNKN